MKQYPVFLLLLSITMFGCSRYDYYPRGIHQSEKSMQDHQQAAVVNTSAHIVKLGETLYSIGRRYGTDFHDLAKRNAIKVPYIIYVGQPVYIKGYAPNVYVPPSAQKSKVVSKKNVVHKAASNNITRNSPVASQSSVHLVWPAKGRVSSGFGVRHKRMHDGIDIAADEGTVVVAAAAGKVVYADSRLSGYGNLIIVRHNSDMFTAYAHNQKNLVKRGDMVTSGQHIAYLGSTGRASGPHLHFEVRRGETAVDPLSYLPKP